MRVLLSSTHPMRWIRPAWRADRRPASSASSPHPAGPAIFELDVGDGVGDAIEGCHQIGEALARFHGSDGEDVRRLRFVAGERRWQRSEPVVDDVDPGAARRGSAPRPRPPWPVRRCGWTRRGQGARRIRSGYRNEVGLQSSGKRTGVRSCTVTSRAAFRDGGTTKLVPCTTSTGPVQRSTAGWSNRAHARSTAVAGIGTGRPARTESGNAAGSDLPARQR